MSALTEVTIKPQESVQRSWTILRVLISIILLTASCMKAHMLATTPMLGDDILHSRWFNIVVVQFETFFGIWLFVGLLPKLTGLASIGCFTIFAAVSGYKAVSGEASCGCWGAVDVNPWYTMLFDLVVVGLLVVFRPKVNWKFGLNFAKQQAVNYCLIAIPLGAFVFWGISQVKFQQLQEVGQVLEHGSVVKLDPQGWINKAFPLCSHCDIGEKIATGHWIVMLYRAGCSECREVTPVIIELAQKNDFPLAVLTMNASEDIGSSEFDNMKPLTGLLNPEITWFVETPIVLELDNSVVKQVLLRDDLKRMRSSDLDQSLLFGQVMLPVETVK